MYRLIINKLIGLTIYLLLLLLEFRILTTEMNFLLNVQAFTVLYIYILYFRNSLCKYIIYDIKIWGRIYDSSFLTYNKNT